LTIDNIFGGGIIKITFRRKDKIYYYNGSDGIKSLLQREIELAKPDAVVFVVGPSYHVSLETAFDLENKKDYSLKKYAPNVQNNIVSDITKFVDIKNDGKPIPVFWTYHPAYMNRNKKLGFDNIVNQLIKLINK
jgi:uracil-DNA glycosylase